MQSDVLIIGCGIAGATAALRLAVDRQRQITVITSAESSKESSSRYAQGGIAGRGKDDSAALLTEDILRAGDGLCHLPAVEILAQEGPLLLTEVLEKQIGLGFDRDQEGESIFALEGAHSRRRILHMGDATGEAIMSALLKKLSEQPNISVLTSHTAVDLLTFPHHARDPRTIYRRPACHGAYVFQHRQREVIPMLAAHTVLATGGLGQIFLNTTNPAGARGDGLAMAHRAGARIANTEYVQFHPTALHMTGTTKFLISEAVRGEGGVLLTLDGDAFMERYSPEWKDLAPRDLVARAIYWEMLERGDSHVLLDIASRKPAPFIRERFPGIHSRCLEQNIDITRQPIPVVPAAHYYCGGVLVDLWGRSSLDGLYAVGESACTGVHGANRLASTSLLEGLVWGDRTAREIRRRPPSAPISEEDVPGWDDSGLVRDPDPALILGDMQNIRNLMWHYVGLVRSEHGLGRAIRELRHLWAEIEDFYRRTRLSDGLIGLRNAVQAAWIVAHAGRRNSASRGCHYREDGPSGPSAPSGS